MNGSCHTYEWVMSHIWMSHVTHMNEPCHTYEWVMSHIWTSHATHMNESCHTYERVMSHISMSHVTHVNGSCHTHSWARSHVTHINTQKGFFWYCIRLFWVFAGLFWVCIWKYIPSHVALFPTDIHFWFPDIRPRIKKLHSGWPRTQSKS